MKTRLAHFPMLGLMGVALLMASGCERPVEAIGLSKTTLDFQLNPFPESFQVWNSNPSLGTLTIAIQASRDWIIVTPTEIESNAPNSASGPFDRQTLQVRVDRSRLPVGTHEGELRFTARGVQTRTIKVSVTQDTPPSENRLEIVGMSPTYSQPYLLDFTFGLRFGDGDQVVAEPAQFSVNAFEDGEPLDVAAPVFFRRGLSRQLKLMLVLDYTLSQQQTPGAIAAMESAAKNVLLPALNETAQVGVIEFHSQFSQVPPRVVVPLTVDRRLVREGIDSIQASIGGLAGGSRVWDACVLAAQQLEAGNPASEERVIVLFSDGRSTSSLNTITDVIDGANEANVKIYAVAFGPNQDELSLQLITGATGGDLYPAANTGRLAAAFREVVDSLSAQYVLRWATLKRGAAQSFRPSFTVALSGTGDSVTFGEAARFNPRDFQGDEFLGRLRFVASDGASGTNAFLRADYMPPGVSRLRLFVESEVAFQVTRVQPQQDGLITNARVSLTDAPDLGGTWIVLDNLDGPIPYAGFGPLLRFDFAGFLPEEQPLFEQVYIDNSIYAAGQRLSIEGFSNTPPEGL